MTPRIVLSHTSHPGNIGASARAMKTMGFYELYLVKPASFPDPVATARSAGADDVLEGATVCEHLLNAVADCSLVIGLTARARAKTLPVYTPDSLPAVIRQNHAGTPVAFVFGAERTGLSNQELQLCQAICTIPTNPDFWSLNISAAVQIMCYEWHRHSLSPREPVPVRMHSDGAHATAAELEGLYQHYATTLAQIDFLDTENPAPLMGRLRRLFGRAGLSRTEVNVLRGILTQTQKQLALDEN